MRLYVDLDTLRIADYNNSALASFSVRRSERFPVEVRFLRGEVVQELPHGARGRVVVKKVSDYSGFPVAWSPWWRKVGYGAATYYLFHLNFHTQQVVDQFITLQGELVSVPFAFEIQWEHRGVRRSTRAVSVVVENDYVRIEDEQEAPVEITEPSSKPEMVLNGPSSVTLEVGQEFIDPGAAFTDNIDAPRTVFGQGVVLADRIGTYTLTYVARDAAGNPADPLTRSITVVDTQAPVIELIGQGIINLALFAEFIDPGARVIDNYDAERVVMGVGAVDTDTVGSYVLTYSAEDLSGNEAEPVTRTVVVS